MDAEYVNIYIQRLLKEVEELTKTKLLNETRIIYLEGLNKQLNEKIVELNLVIEKLNKKSSKAKEVNTSDD